MPLVSVKLPEATKTRVAQLAAVRGISAHAVMVQAIEAEVSGALRYDQFVAEALQARANLATQGQVVDGAAFAAYLRAKAAGGQQMPKPKPQGLTALFSPLPAANKA